MDTLIASLFDFNSVAMNTEFQINVSYIYTHTYIYLAVECVDHMVVLFLDVLPQCFPNCFPYGCTNFTIPSTVSSIPFPYILDNVWFLQTCDDIYLNRCEIIAHHCFDIFSDSSKTEHFFHWNCPSVCLPWKILIQSS